MSITTSPYYGDAEKFVAFPPREGGGWLGDMVGVHFVRWNTQRREEGE